MNARRALLLILAGCVSAPAAEPHAPKLLESNTSSSGNSAFGENTLHFDTSGISNSAFGAIAIQHLERLFPIPAETARNRPERDAG